MKKSQVKKLSVLLFTLLVTELSAQNIGINTTGATPNAAAILDLNTGNSGTMGFLPEQVALAANNTAAPVILPPTGLIIYNTATAGSSPNNVIPGYYYWDGALWQLLLTGSGSTTLGWSILGNRGTNSATNFLGTTDANDLVLKADNNEGLRVTSETLPVLPKVGINDATPGAVGSAMLELKGTNGSVYGPHMQFLTSADAYPISQYINWTHDNIDISFDAYWDGIWRSSYSSAPSFQLIKLGGNLLMRYAATTAAGTGPLAWNSGFVMTGTGLVGLNVTTPQENLSVNTGMDVDQGNTDNGKLTGDPNSALTFGSLSGEGIGSKRIVGGSRQFGLDFYTAYTEKMTILNGGNVGIADTVPTTLLQVGGGTATGKLSIYSQDNFNGQFQIGNPTVNSEASINFISGVTAFGDAATSSSGNNYMWNMGAGNYSNGGNTFSIANVGLGRPVITLTASGNVGIDASGPARELELGGITNTIRIDGLITTGTFYSTATAPTSASAVMFANNTTGDVQALAPSATNGQVLTQTATGPAWQAMGSLNKIQVLTSSGTYTPSAGTKSIFVRMVGGGGGGGGVAATVSASFEDALAAGGGGAGGYCEYYITSVAASYAVTVGAAGTGGVAGNNAGVAGGSTAFNGVTAGGGNGGNGSAAATGIFFNSGGAGGTTSAGTVNIPGSSGSNGVIYVNSASPAASAGVGGSGSLGQGGTAPYIINSATPGNSGTGYGSGGSGAVSTWSSGGNNGAQAGGNGSQGVIIIYEYK